MIATWPRGKILSVLNSLFIEEGYKLYIFSLRPIREEHQSIMFKKRFLCAIGDANEVARVS